MITQNQTTREQALKVISDRIARLHRHLLDIGEGKEKGYKERETETRINECRMLWDRIESETFTHYDPDAETPPPPDPEEQEARHLYKGG